MSKAVSIYGIADPVTGLLYYVGKTTGPLAARLTKHRADGRAGVQRPFCRWLHAYEAGGGSVEIFEIEAIPPGGDWAEAEQFWIAYFRFIGATLKNLSGGGSGVHGYRQTEAHRAKISAAHKGRRKSRDHVAAWRAAMSPRPLPEETKRKISAALKGRPRPLELVARTAAGNRGKRRSAEHCARMSEILRSPEVNAKLVEARRKRTIPEEAIRRMAETKRGRRLSPEHCAAIAAGNRGHRHSAEAREKMAAAARRRPPPSEATRAKLRAAAACRAPMSPEAREKCRAAAKAMQAKRRQARIGG